MKSPVIIAITIDYETWQPIPEGKVIDWNEDIFKQASLWLDIAKKYGIKLTFFIEIAEYLWLVDNKPHIAQEMKKQIQEIILSGHGVELHVHPAWLPQFGVAYENGIWLGLNQNQRLHAMTDQVIEKVLLHAKYTLEEIAREVDPLYKVTTFRAAAFQIQPSERIIKILKNIGIYADSSVCPGEYDANLNYDFRMISSDVHQPYYTSQYSITDIDTESKLGILEIPIFVKDSIRWSFDNQTADYILKKLNLLLSEYGYPVSVSWIKKIKLFLSKKKRNNGKSLIIVGIAHTKHRQSYENLDAFFKTLTSYSFITTDILSNIVSAYRSF